MTANERLLPSVVNRSTNGKKLFISNYRCEHKVRVLYQQREKGKQLIIIRIDMSSDEDDDKDMNHIAVYHKAKNIWNNELCAIKHNTWELCARIFNGLPKEAFFEELLDEIMEERLNKIVQQDLQSI